MERLNGNRREEWIEESGHTKEEFMEEEDEEMKEVDPQTGEVIEPWYLKRVPRRVKTRGRR